VSGTATQVVPGAGAATHRGGLPTRAAGGSLPGTTPAAVHPWVAEGARRVRFGLYNGPRGDWPSLRAWAARAEALGFDSLWIADHPLLSPADCWTTLAALAVHTERVRLGSLVSCVYYRPAALLARVAADVDRLSGGRLTLGLGVGDLPMEFQQLALPEPPFRERAAALAETIALVRGLWSDRGEPVTLRGRYVRAEGARLGARPVQRPHVPLLIAGGGERVTLRQVAEHADMCNFGPNGAAGSAWGLDEVRRKLAALRAHCNAVGRPHEAILRSHWGGVVVGATEAEVDTKLATRADRATMTEAPREAGLPRRFTTHYDVPSVEDVAYVVTAGTPAQLASYYRALVGAGMRYFIVATGHDEQTMRLLAEEVVPHVA
jgi:alkanesulfonate monooxygenase SsuD/methylene tetrahydromethanopterin reductase-like flavin-dependent oxidoreductase (luciferase family)